MVKETILEDSNGLSKTKFTTYYLRFEEWKMPRLFSYTITDDTGFAPHVDKEGAYLSLATCKPRIRGAANREDWVMAVSGKELTRKSGKNVDRRLVWMAR